VTSKDVSSEVRPLRNDGGPENDSSSGARRLPSLTGLRFAAAFGVFGFHFAPYLAGNAHVLLGGVFDHANCGVSFFFILSGVVLTWSRRPSDTRRRFYQRRFARIYPDYLAAWILTIGVIAYEGGIFYLHAGGLSLFLIQAWVPKLAIAQGWNGVSWTLSCEMFFYLVFPFIVGRIERLRHPVTLVPFLCLPTLITGLIGLIRYPHGDPQTLVWLQSVCPAVRLGEFVIGIVLAVELRRGSLPKIRLWAAGLGFVVAYTLLSWAPLRWVVEPALIPFLALVIMAAVQRDLDGRATMWKWSPLVLLGERSYAFYLVHQLVIRVWAKSYHDVKITSDLVGVVWFLLLLVVAVGVSSALFRWLEVPMERRLRGSSSPRLELDDAG
jgi:peptidoglycan/LPS O-acetylase OafA/YrhL